LLLILGHRQVELPAATGTPQAKTARPAAADLDSVITMRAPDDHKHILRPSKWHRTVHSHVPDAKQRAPPYCFRNPAETGALAEEEATIADGTTHPVDTIQKATAASSRSVGRSARRGPTAPKA
jgi:hypothetical protein